MQGCHELLQRVALFVSGLGLTVPKRDRIPAELLLGSKHGASQPESNQWGPRLPSSTCRAALSSTQLGLLCYHAHS